MNMKTKRQIQHLWFIEELLQKILTIAERSFLRKHHNLELANFELRNFIGAILDHPTVIEFFREIVVKCEVKPDEDIYKGIHIKSNCQDIYSSMIVFQSWVHCAEVVSAEIVVTCEVKPNEDIYKGIHIKSDFQDIFNYDHFRKPGILCRSFECLKLLRRNHYKNI